MSWKKILWVICGLFFLIFFPLPVILDDLNETKFVVFLCSAFDQPSRSAGSVEDMNLANRIFSEFKNLEMDPWTDIHYVQLQTPDRLVWHTWLTAYCNL